MKTDDRVYRDLQEHLDRLPVGYPPTRSGVELRILKQLFSPEEARIACQLSMLPEPVARIHKRMKGNGITANQLEEILDRMDKKGIVFSSEAGVEKRYANVVFLVGMYEFQVNRLKPEFVKDVEQYFDEAFRAETLTDTYYPGRKKHTCSRQIRGRDLRRYQKDNRQLRR
jgi:electron transport complex protein RnfB